MLYEILFNIIILSNFPTFEETPWGRRISSGESLLIESLDCVAANPTFGRVDLTSDFESFPGIVFKIKKVINK